MTDIVRRSAALPKKNSRSGEILRHKAFYLMLIAPVVYFIIFKYGPLVNAQIAFKDFQALDGVWKSPWVGFRNFMTFFSSIYFWQLLRNTLTLSLGKLLIGLPLAVILALALNESSLRRFRKTVQTATYLPHFLSWVVMYGVLLLLLSPDEGLINEIIKALGGKPIAFLQDPKWYPWVAVLSDVWKETGWSAIIYLAAMTGIDPGLYEAAEVEGATRLQRIRFITLPGIADVIITIALLRLGTILDAGFHQIFMTYSVPVYSVGDIIDTWVYRQGVLDFQFSLATAVGLFKGVIGLLLVVFFNRLARRYSDSSLF
ncbi:MAG: ABC transporter permease subunit [Rectinemataceae bacterium]